MHNAHLVIILVTLVPILLGVTLSIRLLRMAAQTRNAPELAIGVYCALVTTGSLVYAATFRGSLAVEGESARWLSALFTLCVALGVVTLAVGIWRIFLPGKRWMAAAVMGVGVWIGASWLACILPG